MIYRCYTVGTSGYERYGLKVVKVCKRWRKSFKNFLKDMGLRPDKKVLDRKNNNLNYTPLNCRWATFKESTENRSITVWLKYKGERMRVNDAAKQHGLKPYLIYNRLILGWPIERILTTKATDYRKPVRSMDEFRKVVE